MPDAKGSIRMSRRQRTNHHPDTQSWAEFSAGYDQRQEEMERDEAVRRYPYALEIHKAVFCSGAELLLKIRPANPEETPNYLTTKVSSIPGRSPMLAEYFLRRRWPKTNRERRKQCLGRILILRNGLSIVFHKKSCWRIEIRDRDGLVVDRCRRGDSSEAVREKICLYLEKAYPDYKTFNLSERIVETIIKPGGDVWMDFVRINQKALKPQCRNGEVPRLVWDLGRQVFFFQGDLEPYTAPDSAVCWVRRMRCRFDFEAWMEKGGGDWLWLHNNLHDTELRVQTLKKSDEMADIVSSLGAIEIVFRASSDYGQEDSH